MNGVHDMGGMHGFGPVDPRDEEAFHAEWEKRVPGLTTAASLAGAMNLDEFRHGIERMPPAAYLAAGYYERHLATAETNLIEKGVLTEAEIEERVALLRTNPEAERRTEEPALAERLVAGRRASAPLPPAQPERARFKAGDRVRTRNVHTPGHTRLPRYARGKQGVIEMFHSVDTLPDANAHGRGPCPEPLYNVRFEARELWGDSADGPGWVHIDLWESYLEEFL